MSLTLESLKIFCDVVRQRSFSRGAELNKITQSAASQAVSHIEKRLGAQLIDRSKRPLDVTPEGQLYYEGCRDLVNRYYAIESQTLSLHQEMAGTVKVASIYSVGLYDMNQYVEAFQGLYPKGNVRIQYLHPQRVLEGVLGDEVDLGLISFADSTRDLELVPWREEPMVVICSPSHRLGGRRSVDVKELDGEDFVAFDGDLQIRENVDRYLQKHQVAVTVAMEFDNIEAIKRGVEINAGIAIVPEPTVRAEVHNGTLSRVLLEGAAFVRPLSIIHRQGKVLTPAIISFMDLLKGRGSVAAIIEQVSSETSVDVDAAADESEKIIMQG